MKMKFLAGVAAAGAVVAGGAANAATVADSVFVLVPGQQAVTFQSFNDSSAPETFVGTTTLPVNFQEGTVFLTEPTTGAVSDALTILKDTTGGITILFFSDPAQIPPIDISPHQLSITETGNVQDVSTFFGPGISVQVSSDLNVPEPAAWAMMLVGIGMAGALMRGRNRLARATA